MTIEEVNKMVEMRNKNVNVEDIRRFYEIVRPELSEWDLGLVDGQYRVDHWNEATDGFLAVKDLMRPLVLAELGEASVLEDVEVLLVKVKEAYQDMDHETRLTIIRDLVNVE